MNHLEKFICVVPLSLLVSCSNRTTDHYEAAGIGAEFRVVATGEDLTKVEAQLYADYPSPTNSRLKVSGDDSLEAKNEGVSSALIEKLGLFNDITYVAFFDQSQVSANYQVIFKRGDEESLESTVVLPEDFLITSLAFDAQGISLAWEGSLDANNRIDFDINFNCSLDSSSRIEQIGVDGKISDNGSMEWEISDLPQFVQDSLESCELEVTLERVSFGELSSGFGKGGTIQGIQTRTSNLSFGESY